MTPVDIVFGNASSTIPIAGYKIGIRMSQKIAIIGQNHEVLRMTKRKEKLDDIVIANAQSVHIDQLI
jgi:hypothetical protein